MYIWEIMLIDCLCSCEIYLFYNTFEKKYKRFSHYFWKLIEKYNVGNINQIKHVFEEAVPYLFGQ